MLRPIPESLKATRYRVEAINNQIYGGVLRMVRNTIGNRAPARACRFESCPLRLRSPKRRATADEVRQRSLRRRVSPRRSPSKTDEGGLRPYSARLRRDEVRFQFAIALATEKTLSLLIRFFERT